MVYPSLFPRFRPREEDQRWCEATDRGGCAVNAVGGQAEALPCAAPWARVSKALAAVVAALARHLNGRQPARHFHLDSKSVATIVKRAVVDGLARPRSQPKRAGEHLGALDALGDVLAAGAVQELCAPAARASRRCVAWTKPRLSNGTLELLKDYPQSGSCTAACRGQAVDTGADGSEKAGPAASLTLNYTANVTAAVRIHLVFDGGAGTVQWDEVALSGP